MPTTSIASSSRYKIPTLLERKGGVLSAFAYCPICDKVEKSSGEGGGQPNALDSAVAKIYQHLRLNHPAFWRERFLKSSDKL